MATAVLPFDNYTGDDSQAFLVFGMHDALISELGQLGAIRVISKTSVLAYSNSEKTIKEIASELGVDAIIEASVLVVEEKIRIQLKLFNAFPEEQQLWAQTFDVDMGDILKLYGQVIRTVASEIQLTLSPEQQTQLDEIRDWSIFMRQSELIRPNLWPMPDWHSVTWILPMGHLMRVMLM